MHLLFKKNFHNTKTLKIVILGFKTKGRGGEINRKPEQIEGFGTQLMITLIRVEQRENVI